MECKFPKYKFSLLNMVDVGGLFNLDIYLNIKGVKSVKNDLIFLRTYKNELQKV